MRLSCPLPECEAVLLFHPAKAKVRPAPQGKWPPASSPGSIRQKARSTVRSHLFRHYHLGTRERSLLLDEAVKGL